MGSQAIPRYAGPATEELGRKMTPEEVRGRFDAENAAVYGQRLRNWLPGDRLTTSLILDVLAAALKGKMDSCLLDLGAGTGRSALSVLRTFRGCHVTLVDFSANMLSEAPRTLAGYEERFSCRQADFWEVDFEPGSYDAVTASFALHHGRGDAVYARLYQKVFHWLKPGGIFACCDVVEGDTPRLSAMNEAGWRSFLRRKGFSREDVGRLFSNYHSEDSPLSLRQHLALLDQAGFNAADVLWKRFNFAVYVGLKDLE